MSIPLPSLFWSDSATARGAVYKRVEELPDVTGGLAVPGVRETDRMTTARTVGRLRREAVQPVGTTPAVETGGIALCSGYMTGSGCTTGSGTSATTAPV